MCLKSMWSKSLEDFNQVNDLILCSFFQENTYCCMRNDFKREVVGVEKPVGEAMVSVQQKIVAWVVWWPWD